MPAHAVSRLLALSCCPGLVACDWLPGSSLRWSQSVRTWDPIDSGECLVLGAYTFGVDAETPPFQGKSSLRMRTEFKEDQEFLPLFVDINWRLNGSMTPFHVQPFELKKGKGKTEELVPVPWSYTAGDEIAYELCTLGGNIPIHTQVSLAVSYKFDK